MRKQDERGRSQRQLRVAEEIRHALSGILERDELRDPGLAGAPITVTEVRVSPDLRNATAFVMPLGGGEVDPVVEALRRARPYLRRHIAKTLQLRHVPDLQFIADPSFDAASHIEALLADPRVAQDLGPVSSDDEENSHGT